MAKLTLPAVVVGFKRRRRLSGGRWSKPKFSGKYHLISSEAGVEDGMTPCKLIVWAKDEFGQDDSLYSGSWEDHYIVEPVEKIPANMICKKCLGPIKAED